MTAGHKKFVIDLSWPMILENLGVKSQDLLRHANLPLDLFSRTLPTLNIEEYFRLWHSLEHLVADADFPVRLVEAVPVEAFSPPLFAALCSSDLNRALKRLSQYKPLIGPMRLNVSVENKEMQVTLNGLSSELPPPPSLLATELLFLVNLARLGTRERIVPRRAHASVPLRYSKRFTEFLGVSVERSSQTGLIFNGEDAIKPFLSANSSMFSIFDLELRKRLDDLRTDDGFRERVRACLLEALAAGDYSMAGIARRLAVSTRTLQRNLKSEGTSFQNELNTLREELARHYLQKTEYSSAEISFLLGYEDPNSFFRAFHTWTGRTPDSMRQSERNICH